MSYKSSLTSTQIESVLSGLYNTSGLVYASGNGSYSGKLIGEDIGYPVILSGANIDPGPATEGHVGQFYINTYNNSLFACTRTDGETYTWYAVTSRNIYIKYSHETPTQDSQMKDTADRFMGVYVGSATSAPSSISSYKWYDTQGAAGQNGNDGISPVFGVVDIEGGHRLVLTDKDHPGGINIDIMDGAKGDTGSAVTTSITPTSKGNKITFYDVDHPNGQTIEVLNGSGAGDMVSSTYDPNDAVSNAGGIPNYVKGASPVLTGIIRSANWTGTEAPYTQNITVTGLKADDVPIVDMIPSAFYNIAETEIEDYAKIFKMTVTGDNTIQVYASDTTTVNLNLQLRCFR